MTRLAVDAVGAKSGGVATVLQAVVRAALDESQLDGVVVFASPKEVRRFRLPASRRLRVVDVPQAEKTVCNRIRWHVSGLASAVRAFGADALLLLGGGGFAPPGVRCSVMIQQALPLETAALATLPPKQRARMTFIGLNSGVACRRSDLVIVQTAPMRERLLERLHLDESKVVVVEPCSTLASTNRSEMEAMDGVAADRRLLYVGSDEPYKNLRVLLDAMPMIRRVLSGTTLFTTLPDRSDASRLCGVCGLGTLGQPELASAYGSATLLVMPSLAESVGLPMLEAAASGLPVVAADLPYARAVCGDSAAFFDPSDPRALTAAVVALLTDPRRRRRLSELAKQREARRRAGRPYSRLIQLCMAT